MKAQSDLRVTNPPPKPLMIWDGECHFCRRWIERWREITANEVDYVTYQEAAERFPEIPLEQFQRAVAFIEPDGKTFFAAKAVYRSLACRSSRKWLVWSYDHVLGFAAISEIAYGLIARHRKFGSAVTRLLWGGDVRPPTYFWARRWFLRALGLIYLIAFVSLCLQMREQESPVSRAALFLLKLLLFKLMVMSGVVKLTSGDDCWWNLTALDYHYWSQPLPTIFGWWADQHPEWFKHFSVGFCMAVEIIAPFFIWAPRRPRLIAAGLMIFLQLVIALTGNYCFFNLLTIALCLLLIDDATLSRKYATVADRRYSDRVSTYGAIMVIVVTLPINAWLILTAFKPDAQWPRRLAFAYEHLEPFRIVNGYGLFRVMTKDRREIVIEGSADGIDWLPYEFKWKPGDVKRAPGWCAPHQPRLDWQIWVAALGTPEQNPWFIRLAICLLEGKRDVRQLFAHDPFPNRPPRYVR